MPKSNIEAAEAATTVESTKVQPMDSVKPASPLTTTNEDIESGSVKDVVNPWRVNTMYVYLCISLGSKLIWE